MVIGGVAGAAHGSSFATYDLDVAYARERENLEKLAGLLSALGATLRGAPSKCPSCSTPVPRERVELHLYDVTRFDRHLRRSRGRAPVREASGASLDHLIAMKEAAGRPKDRSMAAEYRLIADELRREPS